MIRFLFRLLSVFSLATAVVMAVIDATRSIAADGWVMTPLAESWRAFSPDTLAAAEEFTRDAMLPELWDPVAVTVLSAPGFAVFAVLALLFYAIGRRPERRGRFATVRT
jgi:hypothetical protein